MVARGTGVASLQDPGRGLVVGVRRVGVRVGLSGRECWNVSTASKPTSIAEVR